MSVREAVELLLYRMNGSNWNTGQFGGITGGGIIAMLQRDFNQALSTWRSSGDTTGLAQMALTMHLYGKLTDEEHAQIMEVLDGEK